ncbi:hypothetical protein PCE38_002175 [Citrobacter freundii]|uniref:hypothetical protein n=1 Tax=Citrobacter portucalensis TaxID=1639133 RepID=UPI001F4904FB|nr:hypothetical protein [Citrobacter portucalensis]EKW9284529.1 hypothetical protein [Citrobacter freundii]MCE9893545.1 hypothetical protein [Citrobacter portucalensis]HCT3261898.1 hypothetical protein [Escherichia coli]
METFKAFLDYFTVTQWVIIGIGFRVFLWILDRLTTVISNGDSRSAASLSGMR